MKTSVITLVAALTSAVSALPSSPLLVRQSPCDAQNPLCDQCDTTKDRKLDNPTLDTLQRVWKEKYNGGGGELGAPSGDGVWTRQVICCSGFCMEMINTAGVTYEWTEQDFDDSVDSIRDVGKLEDGGASCSGVGIAAVKNGQKPGHLYMFVGSWDEYQLNLQCDSDYEYKYLNEIYPDTCETGEGYNGPKC